ncbi:hypothetical protein ZHAS_00015631 [Anopheles sinensis]|uniref:Uncharacterized protein n=1 Tax=Anopheles sinensis TaxID=74873 RepID=A0A084WAZ1_ANOSI|nr:hypothetical protein ZHAS_00015631 [Anopheles sinensis]
MGKPGQTRVLRESRCLRSRVRRPTVDRLKCTNTTQGSAVGRGKGHEHHDTTTDPIWRPPCRRVVRYYQYFLPKPNGIVRCSDEQLLDVTKYRNYPRRVATDSSGSPFSKQTLVRIRYGPLVNRMESGIRILGVPNISVARSRLY